MITELINCSLDLDDEIELLVYLSLYKYLFTFPIEYLEFLIICESIHNLEIL